MSKPCDTHAESLPCIDPHGSLCYGDQAWGKRTGAKPVSLSVRVTCPYLEKVRVWWRESQHRKTRQIAQNGARRHEKTLSLISGRSGQENAVETTRDGKDNGNQ